MPHVGPDAWSRDRGPFKDGQLATACSFQTYHPGLAHEITTRKHSASTTIMRIHALSFGLLACLVSQVAATALTYKLGAHEKACFYTSTQKDTEKIAFYFAVRASPIPWQCSHLANTILSHRFNPVALSMSTTLSQAPTRRLSWREKRSVRATLSSRPTNRETTSSASTTR